MNSCSSGPGSYCSFASVYCLSGEAAAVQFSLFFVTIGFFIWYREAIESALKAINFVGFDSIYSIKIQLKHIQNSVTNKISPIYIITVFFYFFYNTLYHSISVLVYYLSQLVFCDDIIRGSCIQAMCEYSHTQKTKRAMCE
jgi:hypothetical protein